MKRVLVTGGTGFVGANLVRRLLGEGHEVHLLLRPDHATWRIEDVRNDVRVYSADLLDREAVRKTVTDIRPEWVFHLAAYGAYASQDDVGRILETNLMATAGLVEACLRTGFESFVSAGSSSEYGFKDHAPRETDWLEPNSHYAVAKASATMFCRYTAQTHRCRITTLRLYSVYGPFEHPTRFLPTLIVHARRGKLPPLVNPDVSRDYVSARDVCSAFLRAAEDRSAEPGAVYNIGTGKQTSIREVVELARRAFGITEEPRWGTMPDRIWDTRTWVADASLARRELGWVPERGFEEGFAEMSAWLDGTPWRDRIYEGAVRSRG